MKSPGDVTAPGPFGNMLRRRYTAYLFVAPAVLVLALTSVFPIVYAVTISLFDWNWGRELTFAGLGNYREQLGGWRFWQILGHTFYFAASAVTFELVFGLILALAVSRVTTGSGVVRTLLMAPLMVSGIIVALMAKIILDPTLGIVNYGLKSVGLPASAFFGAESSAMPTIILVDTWWQTAFVFIVILAGLQSLPAEPYEASRVDGANRWQQFRYITIPLLRPVILVVLIFRSIDCLKVFAIVFGTTNGGPDIATEVAQTLAYRTAFKVLQIGDAMTIMVIFSAIVLGITLLYVFYGRRSGATAPEAGA